MVATHNCEVLSDQAGVLELRFNIVCARRNVHPITLRLAVWGTVEGSTPCDLLPESARKLIGSECRQRLNGIFKALTPKLHHGLYDDRPLQIENVSFLNTPAALIDAFIQGSRERMQETAEALLRHEFGNHAINNEHIRTALKSVDPGLRWGAAIISGSRHDRSMVPGLIKLAKERDTGIQMAALWALTKIADVRALPVLQQWLLDQRTPVKLRVDAAVALGRIGYRHIPALIKGLDFKELHEPLSAVFQEIGSPALEPLMRTLLDSGRRLVGGEHHYLADGLVKALAALGQVAVGPLIETLKNTDWYVRGHAAETLGRIGDSRAFEPLLHALDDPNDSVRSSAAWALGRVGNPRAVEPLIEFLKREKEDMARANAIVALGSLRDRRVISVLRKVAQSEHCVAALKAKEALWNQFNEPIWPRRTKSLAADG